MKQTDLLKDKIGKEGPFKVPEKYFDTFREKMSSSLPPYPEKPVERKLSVWHRVRPYVYLAAMFAGIWCMMKVFHNVSENQLNPSNNFQDQIAQVMYDQETMDFYSYGDRSDSDIELEDEVMSMYSSVDELEKDFIVVEDTSDDEDFPDDLNF